METVKSLIVILIAGIISSCASIVPPGGLDATGCAAYVECVEEPQVIELPTYEKLRNLPPAGQQIVVAVYEFPDKTGQRKQKGNTAMFSTAVSQGGETMLIDALKNAGKGKWFRVV